MLRVRLTLLAWAWAALRARGWAAAWVLRAWLAVRALAWAALVLRAWLAVRRGLGGGVGAVDVGVAGAGLGGTAGAESTVSPEAGGAEALRMKAQALLSQAEAIRAVSGVDVMALFDTDVDVRGRVLSGEWDFVDVWREAGMRPAPPAPVRAPNGGGMGGMDIGRMDSRQFEKLDTVLRQGGTLDMRW